MQMCQQLVRDDWLHHVCDEHPFEDTANFYRFTADDEEEHRAARSLVPAPFHRRRESTAVSCSGRYRCTRTDVRTGGDAGGEAEGAYGISKKEVAVTHTHFGRRCIEDIQELVVAGGEARLVEAGHGEAAAKAAA